MISANPRSPNCIIVSTRQWVGARGARCTLKILPYARVGVCYASWCIRARFVHALLPQPATYCLRLAQLFVVDAGKPERCYVKNGNERERILGTLAQIDRALTSLPTSDAAVPNIEFALSLDDLPRRSKDKGTFFGYTRKEGRAYNDIWMMPNYAYWSWNYTHAPSWNSIRREIESKEAEVPWAKKDNRVVWRGKVKMAKLRQELVRVSEGKVWSDIKAVVINNATDPHTKDVMNLRQFCG